MFDSVPYLLALITGSAFDRLQRSLAARTLETSPEGGFGLFISALLIALAMSVAPALAFDAPVVKPFTGSFTAPQTVTMSVPSGTIYYTTDGTKPTTSSTQYTAAFTVATPTQINAVTYLSNRYSQVTTVYLDVDPGLLPIVQTGLLLRLRAGFGVVSSGTLPQVSQWTDLSGNGNNAAAVAGQPTLVNSGINDLPAVNFNGSSQALSLPAETFGFSGLSLFVVAKPTSLTASSRIIDLGNGSSGNDILMQISSSGSYGQFWTYSGMSGTSVQSSNALTNNQFQLLEAEQTSGTSATFYLNGSPGSTNSSMNSISSVLRSLNFLGQASGGGQNYSGDIAEVLLYSQQLTTSQQLAVKAYLMQKYQLLAVTPEAPIISVPSGTLSGPTQVMIAAQPYTVTYITTDGSAPTTSSPIYNGCPLSVTYSQTLNAMSVKNGIQSTVSTATYTLDSTQWPAPSNSDMTAPTINLQLPAP